MIFSYQLTASIIHVDGRPHVVDLFHSTTISVIKVLPRCRVEGLLAILRVVGKRSKLPRSKQQKIAAVAEAFIVAQKTPTDEARFLLAAQIRQARRASELAS
ncbi:MAG: hypothetical protein AABN33_10525 [Acidobacteriota bacterium]